VHDALIVGLEIEHLDAELGAGLAKRRDERTAATTALSQAIGSRRDAVIRNRERELGMHARRPRLSSVIIENGPLRS